MPTGRILLEETHKAITMNNGTTILVTVTRPQVKEQQLPPMKTRERLDPAIPSRRGEEVLAAAAADVVTWALREGLSSSAWRPLRPQSPLVKHLHNARGPLGVERELASQTQYGTTRPQKTSPRPRGQEMLHQQLQQRFQTQHLPNPRPRATQVLNLKFQRRSHHNRTFHRVRRNPRYRRCLHLRKRRLWWYLPRQKRHPQ